MNGSTPTERALALKAVLAKNYDEHGDDCNVIDMLTDLRHLCDAHEWDFAALDKLAYEHYQRERGSGNIELNLLP